MIETELEDAINRARQDAITLDFTKWSFQQRQMKLPADHELWTRECDAVLERQHAQNTAAREKYLASVEAQRKAKQAEADAEIDAELEPQRLSLMRDWLANHPDKTENDFNQKAWTHLRENLIEKRDAIAMDAEQKALMRSGRYSL